MIDVNNPVALPFRVNWGVSPVTDYQFKTGVITAADGSEQRFPQNDYPEVTVKFQAAADTAVRISRINSLMQTVMNSAVAVRDFRLNGRGVASEDGNRVILTRWDASWAVGVRVVVEDKDGLAEHASWLSSVDPASRTVELASPVPSGMRGTRVLVGSAVVASIDGEMSSTKQHGALQTWDIEARSFRGLDPIGGAAETDFPFSHGQDSGTGVTIARSVQGLDHQIGRRAEFLGYASGTSGFRSYKADTVHLDQSSKERLLSFFFGCRGRHRSFTATRIDPAGRFRFGADLISVTHVTDTVATAPVTLVRVIR